LINDNDHTLKGKHLKNYLKRKRTKDETNGWSFITSVTFKK